VDGCWCLHMGERLLCDEQLWTTLTLWFQCKDHLHPWLGYKRIPSAKSTRLKYEVCWSSVLL
jgi:hypothetical protein